MNKRWKLLAQHFLSEAQAVELNRQHYKLHYNQCGMSQGCRIVGSELDHILIGRPRYAAEVFMTNNSSVIAEVVPTLLQRSDRHNLLRTFTFTEAHCTCRWCNGELCKTNLLFQGLLCPPPLGSVRRVWFQVKRHPGCWEIFINSLINRPVTTCVCCDEAETSGTNGYEVDFDLDG